MRWAHKVDNDAREDVNMRVRGPGDLGRRADGLPGRDHGTDAGVEGAMNGSFSEATFASFPAWFMGGLDSSAAPGPRERVDAGIDRGRFLADVRRRSTSQLRALTCASS